jgi:GcrA cell cycle regulator
MLALEELSHGACRWPVADCGIGGEKGQFLFCGDAVVERYAAPGVPCPYCACHATAAYKPRATQRVIACMGAHESAGQEFIGIAGGVAAQRDPATLNMHQTRPRRGGVPI